MAEPEPTAPRAIPGTIRAVVAALRLHQWVKNLLVLVPLAGAHRLDSSDALLRAVAAFVAFGCVASGVYVLNDLLDVADDRRHPRKRHRPFASGALSGATGHLLWPATTAVGMGLALATLPPVFAVVLAGYFLLTLAYSLRLKRMPMVDVVALAALYTARLVGGAVAVPVPLSFWLTIFSVFLFTSLAFVKRTAELIATRSDDERPTSPAAVLPGRGYGPADLSVVESLGAAAGYIAVLVYALYIQDPVTATLYRTPRILWIGCPLLLYWISRVWLVAARGAMHEDPVVFAMRDRVSWVIGAALAATMALASRVDWSGWGR